jgi:BT1 family
MEGHRLAFQYRMFQWEIQSIVRVITSKDTVKDIGPRMAPLPVPTAIQENAPVHRKRSRWWWSDDGRGTETLELQPLQSTTYTASPSSTVTPGRLERVLGLDEPIGQRQSDHQVSSSDDRIRSSFYRQWHQYWFPPNFPREIELWRRENVAIPLCYLTVGILQGTIRPLLNVYPIDLGATEAQQTTLASIAMLPSAFKIVFGFLSDNVPIAGYRRKPYILTAWLTTSACMTFLLYSSDLSLPTVNGDSTATRPPTMPCLMLVFFLAGCGIWMADAMVDSFVAQKARLEPLEAHGTLQSTCYAVRFLGLAVMSPLSTYLYSNVSNGRGAVIIVLITMATPLVTVLPLLYPLAEEHLSSVPSTRDQCREIWKSVCSPAVWQPIGFVYVFNLLQVPNAAWRQYLKSVLGFTASQLNILLTASYVMLYVGVVTYKHLFLQTSWRRLYQVCIAVTGFFSLAQLALIRGYTAGLSPFLFALGDDAVSEFIYGLQMLPVAMVMVRLCPVHSEGASYAMFTTSWNSAMMLAQAIGSSLLLGIWDVRKETLISGDLDGLFRLSLLTTMIKLSPLLVVHWFPHSRDDLDALSSRPSSVLGGGLFLLVVAFSVLYALIVALLNVLRPGWAGES